jgi:tetratricopeptide (TPR) repeat protein
MLLKRFNLVSFIVIFIFLIVNKCIPSEDLEERKVLNEELSTISKLLDIGQSSKALDLIEKVTLEYGFSESLNISRGRALVQLGEKAKGESIFREILSQNPHSIDANLYIAKLYSLEKNWDQSDKYISIVLNKDPKNSKALILLGSVILQRDGNVAAARSLIERAARYAPSDPQIQYELGVVRFYDNSPDEAKNAFEKGEELNPDLDPALIGKVYAHYKRLDWAVKQFEKVIDINNLFYYMH